MPLHGEEAYGHGEGAILVIPSPASGGRVPAGAAEAGRAPEVVPA